MKASTSAVADGRLVKLLPEYGGLLAAAGVRPPEDLRRGFPFRVYADQAVPETARGNVRDLAFNRCRLLEHIVDRSDDLVEGLVRVDLGTAVISGGQRPFVLNHRARQHIALVVVQRRTDAGSADV